MKDCQVNTLPWLTQGAKRNAKYKQKPLDLYTFDGWAQFLPFALPDSTSGKYSITRDMKKVGEELPVVSMRNAIFMGLRATKTLVREPTVIHYLKGPSGTWMTTMPQEIEQHRRQLSQASGHVLIGGLGLGVAVAMLAKNPKVKSVTVVELSKDVINLVWPHVVDEFAKHQRITCVQADLYRHLECAKRDDVQYDFAFYDIWQPTGETLLMQHTVPLRKASIGIVKQDRIEQWNEDEMIGQVAMGLLVDPMMDDKEAYFRKMGADSSDMKRYCKNSGSGVYWRAVVSNPPGWNTLDRRNEYLCALKDGNAWIRDWKQYEP